MQCHLIIWELSDWLWLCLYWRSLLICPACYILSKRECQKFAFTNVKSSGNISEYARFVMLYIHFLTCLYFLYFRSTSKHHFRLLANGCGSTEHPGSDGDTPCWARTYEMSSILACCVADLRVGSFACYLHQGADRPNRQLRVSGVPTNKFGGNVSYCM
jgi:hypothetical protein